MSDYLYMLQLTRYVLHGPLEDREGIFLIYDLEIKLKN